VLEERAGSMPQGIFIRFSFFDGDGKTSVDIDYFMDVAEIACLFDVHPRTVSRAFIGEGLEAA